MMDNGGMQNLIPIINKLQDVFTAVGTTPLNLPQLVVVGSQSSGKSSVLEHLVGHDFLPRGSGIVTRRPLILQLIQLNSETDDAQHAVEEWGEFLHLPNQRFTDFHRIRDEIVRETDRLVGVSKGISRVPINLKIYSPRVLNLSLVDLPGMTKVPIHDQPQDIELQIRQMILEYISNPNSIIIAVTPANADLATSDALQIAREVDVNRTRTLGVITKIDLMDKGTDAMSTLTGNIIPLHHGFVGVICRSQADINTNKSMAEQLKYERNFFASHPVYRSISHRLGTAYLSKKLNSILMQHIQDALPELKNRIASTIVDTQNELVSYGNPLNPSAEMGSVLLPAISKFCSLFAELLEGRSAQINSSELYGGARISYIFHDLFSSSLNRLNIEGLSDDEIRMSIRNAGGSRPHLFIPEVCFELLVKKLIDTMKSPSLECIELVYDELTRVALQAQELLVESIRFPALRQLLIANFASLLKSMLEPTKQHVENIINCELAYINTNHSDFIGGAKATTLTFEKLNKHKKPHGHQTSSDTNSIDTHNGTHPAHLAALASGLSLNNTPSSSSSSSSSSSANTATSSTGAAKSSSIFGLFGFRSSAPGSASNSNTTTEASTTANSSFTSAASSSSSSSNNSTSNNNSFNKQDHHMNIATFDVKSPLVIQQHEPTEREIHEVELIKTLVMSYYSIVKKSVGDQVPKAIMHFLVNSVKTQLQPHFIRELYRVELADQLLKEADDIQEKRQSCMELLEILQRAMDIVNQAREFNCMT